MTPLIIPIFLPYAGCHDRCLFCNQKAAAEGLPSPSSIRRLIETSLVKLPLDCQGREKQVAFYGGSFTALKREQQVYYLKEVQPFLASGLVNSVRISTRPDALDEGVLHLLREYGAKTVEIGTQSMIDEVLSLSNRGHSAEDTISAVSRLRGLGFETGLQLMIGLPGDSFVHFLRTLDRIIDLRPDFVRIHPTLVLKGAPLEILWRAGRYSPLSLEEAIEWLKKGLLKLEKASIPVGRVGLQPTKELERDLLAGPFHPALHHLIDSEIFFDMATSLLQTSQKDGRALFSCHPKEVSTLRGQRNENISKLKDQFKLNEILVEGRQKLPRGYLGLQTQEGEVSIHRKSLSF
ncbi:MAG: radical SAM protein [Thermodesulfobacteriota bacterium]|jgi:histone acetyltransferase (RNA polymerase elongator complex component)